MKNILLLIAVVCLGVSEGSPNFGLTVKLQPTTAVTTGVSDFTSAITALSGAVSGLPATSTNADITTIITNLKGYVSGFAAAAQLITKNITLALSDTKTEPSTLFGNIFSAFDDFNTYLSVNGNDFLTQITTVLSSSSAMSTIIEQIANAQAAMGDIITALSDMQVGIYNAIATAGSAASVTAAQVNPLVTTAMGTAVSTAFASIKSQLATVTTNIKGVATAVASTNTYLTTTATTISKAATSINATQTTFQKALSSVNTTGLSFFTSAAKTVAADLKTVTTKLAIFSKDTTLGAYVTAWTAIATAITETMDQISSSNIDTVNFGLATMYSQAEAMIQAAAATFTSTSSDLATALGTQVMSLGPTGAACNSKYASGITGALSAAQTDVASCLKAEQTKAAAVMDIMVRLQQMAIGSHQYIINLIVSCASYSNFAKDPLVYQKAQTCLSTLLPSADYITALYSTLVQPEFDIAASILAVEVDMSTARLTECLSLAETLFSSQATTLTTLISSCT